MEEWGGGFQIIIIRKCIQELALPIYSSVSSSSPQRFILVYLGARISDLFQCIQELALAIYSRVSRSSPQRFILVYLVARISDPFQSIYRARNSDLFQCIQELALAIYYSVSRCSHQRSIIVYLGARLSDLFQCIQELKLAIISSVSRFYKLIIFIFGFSEKVACAFLLQENIKELTEIKKIESRKNSLLKKWKTVSFKTIIMNVYTKQY